MHTNLKFEMKFEKKMTIPPEGNEKIEICHKNLK
jgi:hypothetical protein